MDQWEGQGREGQRPTRAVPNLRSSSPEIVLQGSELQGSERQGSERQRSALAQQATQADLMQYPLPGKGFGGQADHKAEHGCATVTQLGGAQLFGLDLSGSSVLKPAGIRLRGTGHGELIQTAKPL